MLVPIPVIYIVVGALIATDIKRIKYLLISGQEIKATVLSFKRNGSFWKIKLHYLTGSGSTDLEFDCRIPRTPICNWFVPFLKVGDMVGLYVDPLDQANFVVFEMVRGTFKISE